MASENQNGDRRHQEVGHKSLLQSDALYQVHIFVLAIIISSLESFAVVIPDSSLSSIPPQYILETSVYPREPEAMKELREITAKHPWYAPTFLSSPLRERLLCLPDLLTW
ncbi:hypothetical protein BHE74_00038373 [Ensete ventricosum]|nr:hypothetical protein GW17_00043586 [Ensete ventricosum]RWW55004.1 hypothetical protein BHE74_00038373 [Ensete ventricosum]RZS03065.1 hypothetical protein BHM03_00033217 [Ensete ventricosum]